jgi:hypothetical protein
MAYKDRKSPKLTKAQLRLDGLSSIDPALDLGEGISVKAGTTLLTDSNKALSTYNKALKAADDALNELVRHEKLASEWSARALNGVKFKFGPDSSQYEQAGGVRSSERKKPVRKPKAPKA